MGNAFPENGTLTRTELLRARGYELEASTDGDGAEASPEPVAVPVTNGKTARGCRGCGSPLPDDPRQLWCSSSCRKRHTRKAQVGRRSTGTGPVISRPQAAAQAEPSGQPDVLGRLQGIVAQLGPGWSAELSPAGVVLHWAPA